MAKDDENPLKRLAAAIKKRRDEVGVSQEGLAFKSGVSLRHLQKIESGKVDVRVLTLHKIADLLQTTPGKLVDGEPVQRKARR